MKYRIITRHEYKAAVPTDTNTGYSTTKIYKVEYQCKFLFWKYWKVCKTHLGFYGKDYKFLTRDEAQRFIESQKNV